MKTHNPSELLGTDCMACDGVQELLPWPKHLHAAGMQLEAKASDNYYDRRMCKRGGALVPHTNANDTSVRLPQRR